MTQEPKTRLRLTTLSNNKTRVATLDDKAVLQFSLVRSSGGGSSFVTPAARLDLHLKGDQLTKRWSDPQSVAHSFAHLAAVEGAEMDPRLSALTELARFLTRLATEGDPPKVSRAELRTMGFTAKIYDWAYERRFIEGDEWPFQGFARAEISITEEGIRYIIGAHLLFEVAGTTTRFRPPHSDASAEEA